MVVVRPFPNISSGNMTGCIVNQVVVIVKRFWSLGQIISQLQ